MSQKRRRVTIFVAANVCFISGLCLPFVWRPWPLLALLFILLGAAAWYAGNLSSRLRAFGICCVFFGGGIFLGAGSLRSCPEGNICSLLGGKVQGSGIAGACKLRREGRKECEVFSLEAVRASVLHDNAAALPRPYKGKVIIRLPAGSGIKSGDAVFFSGVLEKTKNSSSFDYERYLRMKGVYASIRDPDWAVEIPAISNSRKILTKTLSAMNSRRVYMQRQVERLWSPSTAALMSGLLIGDAAGFSETEKQTLRVSGIYHIVAVSGSHIVLITNLMLPVFFRLGFSRKPAAAATILTVLFFVVFIGAPSSAVRAWIMGSLSLLAKCTGRQASMHNGLLAAASVMLALNPLLLFYDAGFQLSFCAAIGLGLFTAKMEQGMSFIPERWGMRKNAAATLAAQIATVPVSIFHFRFVSLVAPLTNFLVLPCIEALTVVGALSFVLSFISMELARLPVLVAHALSSYVLAVSRWCSLLPLAGFNI